MRLKMKQSNNLLCGLVLIFVGCSGEQNTTNPSTNNNASVDALRTLNETIKPITTATVTTSNEIDWPVCILPWDRFTLPVFAPSGMYAAVQLGKSPDPSVIVGNTNEPVETTTISIHPLDPNGGKSLRPIQVQTRGLLLSRASDEIGVFVESPKGENGRWLGRIDWKTGKLQWLVADNEINAFPTINSQGEIAWSRKTTDENRFHLVVHTTHGKQVIDDGESDWLFPLLLGSDRMRAYKLYDGKLSIVEFNLLAEDPLLTAVSYRIMESGATRELVWHVATTNPHTTGSSQHAFYYPVRDCMSVWNPNDSEELTYFLPHSLAAVPTSDGSWLVSLKDRVIRQEEGGYDGIHIRNHLAIPFATTSKQWTHYMLIPDGTRLQVRAVNLDQ